MSPLDPVSGAFSSEPVFSEPWQASAFAIAVSLHERGLFTWPEWAATLAEVIKDEKNADAEYYAQWLAALELLVKRNGLAGGSDIDSLAAAWSRAAEATLHGVPIRLENDPMAIRRLT